MHFTIVNDWADEEGGYSFPDPVTVFSCTLGILRGAVQFSLIVCSVGFAITIGDMPEEED